MCGFRGLDPTIWRVQVEGEERGRSWGGGPEVFSGTEVTVTWYLADLTWGNKKIKNKREYKMISGF